MSLQVGIVGLPNVGKSTLFNAVTAAGAEAANYPFATIEPNVGVVAVRDPRLDDLARLAGSAKVVPTTLELVDIAGLVEGASKGEGLGNQFLAHIRDVDAIAHVVRCFTDPEVVHIDGSVDPGRDVAVIETELLLKDLETVERRTERSRRAGRSGDKDAQRLASLSQDLLEHLQYGKPARTFPLREDTSSLFRELGLLTAKPVLYVANVAEQKLPDGGALVAPVRAAAERAGAPVVVLAAEIESELAELDEAERREFLSELGLERSGLDRLVDAAYRLLDLITFFTADPQEARAWTIRRGIRAPRAAGSIHSDMERGFIRAEIIAYDDYAALGSEAAAREAGRLRVEGKEYVMADGDVMHVRFNV